MTNNTQVSDAFVLPSTKKLDAPSIQRLQEQYDKYCAVVTDRERQRPASQRVKPQSVVHCFTAAQLKLVALDELELASVDDLTETTLKQWMVDTINDLRDGHGL